LPAGGFGEGGTPFPLTPVTRGIASPPCKRERKEGECREKKEWLDMDLSKSNIKT
jgi:hypothetical protein